MFFQSQRIHTARGKIYTTRDFFTARGYIKPEGGCTEPEVFSQPDYAHSPNIYVAKFRTHTAHTHLYITYFYNAPFLGVSLKSKAPANAP
jgi:hypothetical protein